MANSLESYARSIFEPLEDIRPYEWCEKNIVLPPKVTQDAGPYASYEYPFAREILDFWKGEEEELTLLFGSQNGKTTLMILGLLWSIKHAPPQSIMWIQDTTSNARRTAKDKLDEIIDVSPVIKSLVGTERGDDMTLEKRFTNAKTLYLGGSNSVGNLSSITANTYADETDKFPAATDKESGAIELIESRSKVIVGFKKKIWSSTPTTEDGPIWKKWEGSDKRYFNIPCKSCGELHVLETSGITWDQTAKDETSGEWDLDLVESSARYACPHCGALHDDNELGASIRDERAKWIATRKNRKHKSYHLHSLYSPRLTIGELAREFIESKSDSSKMQKWTTNIEAKPWKDRIIEVKETQIKKCEADHYRGDKIGKTRLLAVDVQRKDLRYNLRGYDDKSRLIDWGTVATWEDVRELQVKYNCEYVGIDTQFPDRQQEAFNAIYENKENGWIAIEGKGKNQGLFGKLYNASLINPFVGDRKKAVSRRDKITYLQINSEVWKGEVARKRNAESPEWQVYQNIEAGYTKELYAEYQKKVMKRGRTTTEWHCKSHGQNHQFDLECYQLALAHYLKIEPYHHGRIRNAFEGEDEAEEGEAKNEEPENKVFKPVNVPNESKSIGIAPNKGSIFQPVINR